MTIQQFNNLKAKYPQGQVKPATDYTDGGFELFASCNSTGQTIYMGWTLGKGLYGSARRVSFFGQYCDRSGKYQELSERECWGWYRELSK